MNTEPYRWPIPIWSCVPGRNAHGARRIERRMAAETIGHWQAIGVQNRGTPGIQNGTRGLPQWMQMHRVIGNDAAPRGPRLRQAEIGGH